MPDPSSYETLAKIERAVHTTDILFDLLFALPVGGIATIAKGNLAPLADHFDAAVKESNQYLDARLKEHKADLRRQYGEGFVYYNNIVPLEFGLGLAKVLQTAGSGLTDLLRFGESSRDPSAGAVFRDGMRLLSIADNGFFKAVGRLPGLLRSRIIPGGKFSCAVSSFTSALVLSGQRLSKPVFQTFDEVARAFGTTAQEVWSGAMTGTLRSQRAPALKALGVEAIEFGGGVNIRDVARYARQADGPIVMTLIDRKGLSSHAMTMYRSLSGEIRLIDQHGVWTIEFLFDGFKLKNIAPTALGRATGKMEVAASKFSPFIEDIAHIKGAQILPDWAQRLMQLPVQGARAMAGTDSPDADTASPLSALAIPFFELSPTVSRLLHLMALKATNRLPPVQAAPAPVPKPAAGGGAQPLKTQQHLIPAPPTQSSESGALPAAIEYMWYVVGAGVSNQMNETLFGLARTYYGNPAMAGQILDMQGRPFGGGRPGNAPLPKGMMLKLPKVAR